MRGRFRGGRKREVKEDKLDDDLEKYWKSSGDDKVAERFEEINEEHKKQKESKEKGELDESLDAYWQKKEDKKEEN